MAFISRDGLKGLLFNRVVELKFQRRHPTQDSKTRRMFCIGAYPNIHTNEFLATIGAQSAFRFRYPKGSPPFPPQPYYNPDRKNLVITWDIMMQNYRCITVNRCNIIKTWPVRNQEEIDAFWGFFNEVVAPMSVQEKIEFHKK